jgi:hypothetical protein
LETFPVFCGLFFCENLNQNGAPVQQWYILAGGTGPGSCTTSGERSEGDGGSAKAAEGAVAEGAAVLELEEAVTRLRDIELSGSEKGALPPRLTVLTWAIARGYWW